MTFVRFRIGAFVVLTHTLTSGIRVTHNHRCLASRISFETARSLSASVSLFHQIVETGRITLLFDHQAVRDGTDSEDEGFIFVTFRVDRHLPGNRSLLTQSF